MDTTKRTYVSIERGRGCEESDPYNYTRTETFDFVAEEIVGSLVGYSGSKRVNETWRKTFAELGWKLQTIEALDAARRRGGWSVVE